MNILRIKQALGIAAIMAIVLLSQMSPSPAANAQGTVDNTPQSPALGQNRPSVDITSEGFRVVVCDGPHNPAGDQPIKMYNSKGAQVGTRPYVVCSFNTLMLTVQHVIDILMVLGVLVALGTFCYVGFLYIKGQPGDISKAHSILPKVFIGFILMLAAWFIVYEVLDYLGASKAYTALLGNP